ncbi:Aminopeptidase N [Anthophora quadrimaculata]
MSFVRNQFSIVIFLLLFSGYQGAINTNGNEESLARVDEENSTLSDYRLPKTLVPLSYEILLIPDFECMCKLKGTVHINIHVKQSTNTITFHSGQIEITMVTVTFNGANVVNPNTIYNNTTEKYEIKLRETLKPNSLVTVSLQYNGKIRTDMIGFYKSSYVDSYGKIKWLLTTQFQTTHARHAFPCFDEPSFKATFVIRILRPEGYASLSNMPLKRTIPAENKSWDEFEQSIPMSTYLVAFVISDFKSVKIDNFKVWTRPNAIDQAKYALTIGNQTLDSLSKRFKQDYQISKMDMVAVPDFSAGAMENWGLVTYRESRLLYDESTTSDVAKQTIASVIVHELTHMWFGNQITPEWWSYLWLSEAFARYFQYFGTAQIETTWNMEEQFLVEQHQTAYAADGIETSQPMTRNVITTSQISSVGDTITYNKGGSILRMMNLIFGSDVYDVGLQNYLNNSVEKVGHPDNLWVAIQNEVNRLNDSLQLQGSVKEIMTTWTEQPGFPVVTVSIGTGTVHLEQKRFLLRNLKATPTNTTWWIPITWATSKNRDFNKINVAYWLNQSVDTIPFEKSPEWAIFNVQSSGFYRVNYDNDSWYRIFDALNTENHQGIHVLNRAALVDDLLNLARAGLLDYKVTLDGLKYLVREENYLPFKAAFSGFTYLDQRFSADNKNYNYFKKFVLTLIKNKLEKLGYLDRPGDDRLTILLRGELSKWACKYDHKECVQTFVELFKKWKQQNIKIKPNQQPVAYCMGVKHGTTEDWEFLWNQYYNSISATEQEVILQALGCTRDVTLLERYLLYALKDFEESRIRKQDNSAVFSAVSGSSKFGSEFVLDFVSKHYAEMKQFYTEMETTASILASASQRFSTQELVDKFDRLIQQNKVEFQDVLKSLNNSLEVAKYELQWYKKYSDSITSWIVSYLEEYPTADYRLPTTITPKSYSIWVTSNVSELDNFLFTGTVNITATVTNDTSYIVLHSVDLKHTNISVHREGKKVDVLNTAIDKKYNVLIIKIDGILQVGENIDIMIEYEGHLNEVMRGFYRSWYKDSYGNKRWLAATQMEPVGARKMFPCFDEPSLKATFTMSVTIPETYRAISNMPVDKMYLQKNTMKRVIFKETPKMSTYLVVLIISDFVSSESEDEVYGVWARHDAIAHTKYALSLMEPLVHFYQEKLGFPYQLPKLDMIALPDFISGAMENWGLLTYKERNVLYDPYLSTTASKQSITNVISHEISHQWFGNLVTPLWWKYIWLNEGFARYFQYFATNDVTNGTWFLESQFIVDHLQSALEVDSAVSSHALTNDVDSPTKISEMFDTITYGKGASVIRMIAKSIGHDAFYKGLQSYLQKRQYNVAVPEDLFDAFKNAITDEKLKNSIHDIMNSWTTQPGYPIVHATFQGNRLELRQERFLLNRENVSTERTWLIPITWTCFDTSNFNETEPKYWLENVTGSIELSCEHYLLNLQQSGFYRTNYDTESWQRIIHWLKSDDYNKIHEINRATLIDDLLSLARAEYVDYVTTFTAIEYLNKETSYYPWRAFFNHLPYLYKQFEGKDAFGPFEYYVSTLLTPIYKKLGFDDQENDDHVTQLFRSHVRKWACKFDVADCKARALSYFNSWNINATVFPSNYHSVSYCTGAEQNDPQSWNRLWNYYLQSTFAAEKSIVLQSLACTTDKVLLNELLNKVFLNDSEIRLEDISGVFTSVIDASPEGIECVINSVRNKYDEINKHNTDILKLDSILNTIEKHIYTYEIYEKYTQLITWLQMTKPWDNSNHAYRNLQWTEKHIPKIHQWLETRYRVLNYRLPKLFTPLKYNISLSPYFEERNFTFDGSVQIEMKRLMNYTSRIVVHAHELNINKVSVYQKDSNLTKEERLNVKSVMLNTDTQMLTIFLENFIKSDEVLLDIDFTGTLNDKMEGFYRSYYVNKKGNVRWLATTHFEPTYARKAFPCFDEPAFKAKFVINMERPKDYIVLSNMPRELLIPSAAPDRVWDKFTETVQMSTYSVAFVVSDFEPVRNSYEKVQVWGRPEIAVKGDFAEIAATRFLGYLASETGHEYILPKLDLIGIPDFSMGAMENWGLVTFREYGLFYDKNITTAKYMDYITTIIAHELSHMLYGNLVTCDWWEYIWLNEGFAEYMQWRLSHLFRPAFGFDDLFVVDELQAAMQSDGAHPMNNPVSKPSEIAKVFDTVTYGKSSSVIRMIQKSLRPEIFTNATNKYLLKHQFKTATPKDLWQAFDDEIKSMNNSNNFWNISMETLMYGWTNKPGYPVVSATLDSNNNIILTQKNFTTYENIDNFWIPITLTTSAEMNFITTTTDIWLGGQPLTIYLKNPATWFLLNIQQSGYYRVNYDDGSWSRLINALKSNHDLIHVTNRAQIIDDLLNLARAGHVHYYIALNGTTYLQKERNYLPWKAFFNGMNFILQRYEGQHNLTLVTNYILQLTNNLFSELDFVDTTMETHFNQLNRELILTWTCKLGNKVCINKSVDLFRAWRESKVNKISPNARPAVYCTAIKHGSEEDWRFLWQQYLEANLSSEKQIILNALGCTNSSTILNLHIQYALTRNYTSHIRRQDINAVFASIYKTGKHGIDLILDFISQNYTKLYDYYGNWDGFEDLISKLAPLLSTTDQISKLKELPVLMSNYSNVQFTIQSAVEFALNNQNWYEQHSKDINTWLVNYNAGGKTIANSLHIILMTVFSIIVYIFNH